MDRRDFIRTNVSGSMAIVGSSLLPDILNADSLEGDRKSYALYLRNSAVSKEDLNIFLNEDSWAQFDPEVGYIFFRTDSSGLYFS